MTTKAVIYARYSSHNQREESIEDNCVNVTNSPIKTTSPLLQNTVTVPSLAKPITDQNFSA